ncbi:MAG: DEAD/DEAH box helicase [Bacteroidota bacterium]
MISFEEMGLNGGILSAVRELGFEQPTLIQAKIIPQLLTSDQDVIGFAQTGTGKTAAYGLPAIHLTDTENRKTQTLVLCPTRELCMQIVNDLVGFSRHIKGLGIVAVYGGASIDAQIQALYKDAQIVVGTPGRVKDLIERKKLKLGYVGRVVLDEADEMLSMGFRDDLDAILSETPEKKQTLLFSATMSNEILAITKKYMRDPVRISATPMNTGAENVRHVYYMVQAKDRYEVLKRIADINPNIYGIVFCRTRSETKETAAKLMNDGYNADALHGDLSQAQRDEVMGRFRVRHLQLLVATDVAARGLDVTDLTHIINYNLPDDSEVYIHRSGRTGRAGKRGVSTAIIHTRETGKIRDIEKRFGIRFSREPVPTGNDICHKQLYSLIDKIEKVEVDDQQIGPFMPDIYKKLEWLDREDLIKHFVSAEFNRFLSYYKNSRDINIPEPRKEEWMGKKENRKREDRKNVNYSRLFINAGSKNNLNPARLIGLVNEGLDSGDAAIGKIEIMKTFSFFEIDSRKETQLLKALNGKYFEGQRLNVELSQEKPSGAYFPKVKKAKTRNILQEELHRDNRKKNGSDRRKKDRKW